MPPDHKWFARMLMATVVVDALDRLHLDYPRFDPVDLRRIRRLRKALLAS